MAFSIFLGVGEAKIALAEDTHSIDKTKEPAPPAHTENKDKEKVNPYAITVLKEQKEFKNAYDKEKDIKENQNMVKSELEKVRAQYKKTQNKEETALLLKLTSLRAIEKRTSPTDKQAKNPLLRLQYICR